MPDTLDLPLAFTRADAAARGLRRSRLDRDVAGGVLCVVAPGLYAEAVRWHVAGPTDRHLALAHEAHRRFTRSVLSHTSAALAWGLPDPRSIPERPNVTVDLRVRTSDDSQWCRVLRCRLPPRHVTAAPCPLTTLSRTVVDCFRDLPMIDALAIADATVGAGVTPGELVEVRTAQARWPGVGRARRGIGLVDGRRESWLESASMAVLDSWLPLPVPQVEVWQYGVLLGRGDLLWWGLRVIGEADGRGKFRGEFGGGTSERSVADRLLRADVRAQRFEEAGLGVVRWGTPDLALPQILAARIRAAAPRRPRTATLVCGTCPGELDRCSCAPRLRLPDR